MRLPAILVADLHLTANPRDEYRWGLWAWLRDQAVKEKAQTLVVLGDLSDAKDFHSSAMVNRLANEVRQTAGVFPAVRMIPGNHEWLKSGEEYWRFLNHVHPNVTYMTRPTEDPDMKGPGAYYLPFTKDPARDWAGMSFEDYDYVFMHQTVKGAICSNGEAMDGEAVPYDVLRTARKIYSGDIHVPQRTELLEYVGSPYHVHFGDAFTPRVVLLENNGNPVDLHFPTLSRTTLKVAGLADLEHQAEQFLRKGDQVKLRVDLAESEKHAWKAVRRECLAILKDAGVEVHGVELVVQKSDRRRMASLGPAPRGGHQRRMPGDEVLRFVEAEELGAEALDVGLGVLES